MTSFCFNFLFANRKAACFVCFVSFRALPHALISISRIDLQPIQLDVFFSEVFFDDTENFYGRPAIARPRRTVSESLLEQ